MYVSCSNVGSRVRGLVATSILGRPVCSMSAMKRPACWKPADKVGRPEKASRSSCNDQDGSKGSKALASIGKVARGEGDRGDTQNIMNHLKALAAQGNTKPHRDLQRLSHFPKQEIVHHATRCRPNWRFLLHRDKSSCSCLREARSNRGALLSLGHSPPRKHSVRRGQLPNFEGNRIATPEPRIRRS